MYILVNRIYWMYALCMTLIFPNRMKYFVIILGVFVLASCSVKKEVYQSNASNRPSVTSYGPAGRIINRNNSIEPLPNDSNHLKSAQSKIAGVNYRLDVKNPSICSNNTSSFEETAAYSQKREPGISTTLINKSQERKEKQKSNRAEWSFWLAISLFTPLLAFFLVTWPLALIFSIEGQKSKDAKKVKKARIAKILLFVWLAIMLILFILHMISFSGSALYLPIM